MTKSLAAVFACLLSVCAAAVTYLYHDQRLACVIGDYERYEWSSDGMKGAGVRRDGSPDQSIQLAVLWPHAVTAEKAFRRITLLVSCERELDYAARISYVELRSAQLTDAVQAWRLSQNNTTGFRREGLKAGPDLSDRSDDKRNLFRKWNNEYFLQNAPAWLPKGEINERSFVASWGYGYLFKGSGVDQYYWIGSFL
ncbi:hypothetical protein [Massilia scottii]|uniref:hypothetical protein n=1 Tax=Massilia scottii TaxID=3057166 RepID=UPI002796508D|nr:hypothetical protein [Massilia sp. CCM 9029]MDQ1832631.1 hypothetical protein [Massilia sp. CCM 9029]